MLYNRFLNFNSKVPENTFKVKHEKSRADATNELHNNISYSLHACIDPNCVLNLSSTLKDYYN